MSIERVVVLAVNELTGGARDRHIAVVSGSQAGIQRGNNGRESSLGTSESGGCDNGGVDLSR
jgi:hypothetical protein